MRRIGNTLLWTGVGVGAVAGVWAWIGPKAGGIPWLLGVGLIKLTIIAALALIAVGAVALRIANRRERQRLLDGIDPEVVITADRKAVRQEADRSRRTR